MKKLLIAVTVLVLSGVAAVGYATSERGINRRIDRAIGRANTALLDDGQLHVFLCGTAAALPDKNRAGACTAIIANGEFLLFDAGPASWRNVDLMNLPTGKLSGIFITHFHSDHIGEIGEALTQSWIAGRKTALDVYGPRGIERILEGFRLVYAADTGYRVAHHDEQWLPRAASGALAHGFDVPDGIDALPVFERNGVRVSAFRVQHAPVDPAVGYRIEYRGRVVVISGDTTKTQSTIKNAAGADLLIHEALASEFTERASARAKATGHDRFAKLAHDVGDYHTTPVEAAQVAHAAGAKKLVITHVFPQLPNAIAKRMFMRGASKAFAGPIVLGEDGMEFTLQP